jgi:lysophospholipase
MEAAPLVSIPQSPVPGNGTAEWFTGAGEARLRAAVFQPDGTPRGSVVINTGRTESIEKYFEVVGELLGRGFAVLIHDWRGQGLSQRLLPDRLNGHAEGFDDFLADFRTLLDRFDARLPRPWLLLGHSMGGCLSMLALTAGEQRFAGCVLTSPMFGVRIGPLPQPIAPGIAWILARCGFSRVRLPGGKDDPFWKDFARTVFTHDRRRFERYSAVLAECPDLALGRNTWGWLDSAFAAIGKVQGEAAASIPIVILSAGEDQVVDNAAHKRLRERLPDARVIDVPGSHHEIMIETDPIRARFWSAFDEMADRLAPRP